MYTEECQLEDNLKIRKIFYDKIRNLKTKLPIKIASLEKWRKEEIDHLERSIARYGDKHSNYCK